MRIIIFAGGTGRRLWPISRAESPKQFESILGERSTVQLAVDRILDQYGAENIFISTNQRYQSQIQAQLPELPERNVIGEPVRRDLAPAVGLAMAHLAHGLDASDLDDTPVAILWGDNYMSETETFRDILATAAQIIRENEAEIVFMGETPRFANENLGWIELGEAEGEANDRKYYAFKSWTYRPPLEKCKAMFESGRYVWNTGYFATSLGFVQRLYREHQAEMAEKLERIQNAIGTEAYEDVLAEVYPQMETISFDDAILTHVKPEQAVVIHGEMGWSDPGTLYALKEAVEPDTDKNVEQGLVLAHDSQDCLIYNYESDKLLVTIGLEGMIVVNMDDALLVVHKDDVPRVKEVVNKLKGTDLEKYS